MAKTFMSASKKEAGETSEFDYILSPSVFAFLYPLLGLAVIFFIPFALVHLFPNLPAKVGLAWGKWTFFLWGLLLTVLNVGVQEIRRRSRKLKLHFDYLVFETGIFFTKTAKIFLTDIKTMELTKTVFERVFNLGTIRIATAGTDDYEVKFQGFSHPDEVIKYLSDHRKEGE